MTRGFDSTCLLLAKAAAWDAGPPARFALLDQPREWLPDDFSLSRKVVYSHGAEAGFGPPDVHRTAFCGGQASAFSRRAERARVSEKNHVSSKAAAAHIYSVM
jgi:hypothetical protein